MPGGARSGSEGPGEAREEKETEAEPGSGSPPGSDGSAAGPQSLEDGAGNGGPGTSPASLADTSLVEVSESRLRVLKRLHGERRTASELARDLDLNKSTVHGYLQDLVDDGLVHRDEDEERLWVYTASPRPAPRS